MSIKLPKLDEEKWRDLKVMLSSRISDLETFEKLLGFVCHQKVVANSIRRMNQSKKDRFLSFSLPHMQRTILNDLQKVFPDYDDERGIHIPSSRVLYMTRTQVFYVLSCFLLGLLEDKRILNIYQNQSSCSVTQMESFMSYIDEFVKRREAEGNDMIEYRRVLGPEIQKIFSSEHVKSIRLKNNVEFHSTKKIEECENRSHQVVFANERIGGKYFQSALLQEEIVMTVNPELLVLMLLKCQIRDSRSSICVRGTRQYSYLTGYAYTSKFSYSLSEVSEEKEEELYEEIEVNGSKFRILENSSVIFMDSSMNFQRSGFCASNFRRDVEKALSGFKPINEEKSKVTRIATGHWGCGAFRHLPERKFLEQWISASVYGVKLDYCCFKKRKFEKDVKKFVGEVMKMNRDGEEDEMKFVSVFDLFHVLDGSGGNIPNKNFLEVVMEKLREQVAMKKK